LGLLLIATLTVFAAQRSSAAMRHRIWCLAFLGLVLLPILCLVVPRLPVPLLPGGEAAAIDGVRQSASPRPTSQNKIVEGDQTDGSLPETVSQAEPAATDRHSEFNQLASAPGSGEAPLPTVTLIQKWLLGLWFLTALVLIGRLALESARVWRLVARCRPLCDDRCKKLLANLRARLRVRQSVRLLECDEAIVPLTCGLVRPVILLPTTSRDWSEERLRHVLLHELAHIQRFDVFFQMIARTACSLYWFNPLVWYALGRLRVERELACDDCVVATGESAVGYADQLVEIARSCRSSRYAVGVPMARSSNLEERIVALLDRARSHRLLSRPVSGLLALTAMLLVMGATAFHPVARAAVSIPSPQSPSSQASATDPQKKPDFDPKSAREIKPLPSKEINGEMRTLRGRVVTPDGRPAAGARVAVCSVNVTSLDRAPPIATTQAQPDGMFEISYLPAAAPPGFDLQKAAIIAQSPGFGLQWAHWPDIDAAEPFVLRLERDLPIRGRVVDLQGSPLAGIRVEVLGFERMADGNLDAALASMRSDRSGFSRKRSLSDLLERVAGQVIPPVTTDKEGRFSLPGLGAERLVRLEFLGPNMAYTKAQVANRTKLAPVPPFGAERLQVFGAEFTLTAPPTRPIVGTIRDAKTRKALAGVRVQGWRLLGSPYLTLASLVTETDSNGRYELRGMPAGQGNIVRISSKSDRPYLVREVRVAPKQGGLSPVTVDVELHHAVWIEGRVTDKTTGQPIAGAFVWYEPFLSNPFTFDLPEFNRSKSRRLMEDSQRYWTDADGRFRIAGVPGRALVGVLALGGNYLRGIGASEIRVPAKDGSYETYQGRLSPQGQNAVKEIDPPADAREAICDFVLVPGESVGLNVVDSAGRPLYGSWGLNIRAEGVDGSDMHMDAVCEVRSLAPGETRHVWILNRERKLGRYFEVKAGNRPREITVQLEPCATLTGRVVDAEGAAVEGVVVNAHAEGLSPGLINAVQSGADGRFTHPYLTGGCHYEVVFSKPMSGSTFGLRQLKGIRVEAGQTKDLGEIKLSKRN
jgi:beta-lactamase regulating signal transducer with metallopeptidase domain/protocatechuate 3,4-dioxygenase beta subunit